MNRVGYLAIAAAFSIGSAAHADTTYQQECQTSRVNGRLQSVCTSSFDTGRGPPSREDVVVIKPKAAINEPVERNNFCGLHFRMTGDGCQAVK